MWYWKYVLEVIFGKYQSYHENGGAQFLSHNSMSVFANLKDEEVMSMGQSIGRSVGRVVG